MAGPLEGLKVVEMVGLGPAPFCSMLLADMGAEVIRVDQKRRNAFLVFSHSKYDVMARGRRSLIVDLKKVSGRETALRLIEQADALVEGFRPGVMEKLGLSPEICLQRNPRLVFGRMTGWGQTGPLSQVAGHDLNYIALSGALNAMGRAGETPAPPLNLVGDFGGGGMMLAFGVVCALLEAKRSGKGQVVDAAMTDGTALLSSMFFGMLADNAWSLKRDSNLTDGGAYFYNTYECADGKFVSVGPLEPQFFKLLCEKLGIADDPAFQVQYDKQQWPALKLRFVEIFKQRRRDEWDALLEGSDCCYAPILDFEEATKHPHNVARKTFIEIDGVTQPAPAPRFSRTPPEVSRPPANAGEHSRDILADWKFDADEIAALIRDGVI